MDDTELQTLVLSGLATTVAQARFYGVSQRTMADWRKKKAPLGTPAAMVAWWGTAFPGRPINPEIFRAIGKVERGAATGPPDASAPSSAPPPPAPAPRPPVAPDDDCEPGETDGEGCVHMLKRMEQEEARLHREITALRKSGRHAEAAALRPAWQRSAEALGQTDARHVRSLLHRGDLLPRERVEREYGEVIRHMPDVLRSEFKDMRLKLDPVPPAPAWEAQIDAILDDIFRAFPAKLMAAINGPTSL